jgi:hypothetical protein
LQDLASKTRDDVAIEFLGRANRRVRDLEAELDATCCELAQAQELCRSEGIVVELELSAPVAAAFASWKQRHGEPEPVGWDR